MGALGFGTLNIFPYTPLVWKHRGPGQGTTQAASLVECEDLCLYWDNKRKKGEPGVWSTAWTGRDLVL